MHKFAALVMVAMVAGSLCAQQGTRSDEPPKAPHIIGIRFFYASSECRGYCHSELRIEVGLASLSAGSWEKNKRKCPDLQVRLDLPDKSWRELIELVNRERLLALPDKIGCPGCADQEAESLEVLFSDGTKKAISSARLLDLEQKLRMELPAGTVARCRK